MIAHQLAAAPIWAPALGLGIVALILAGRACMARSGGGELAWTAIGMFCCMVALAIFGTSAVAYEGETRLPTRCDRVPGSVVCA